METKTINGIISIHDIPVESSEYNKNVIFIHNLKRPLGVELKDFAGYGSKVSLFYYISDIKKTEGELTRSLISALYGSVDCDISSHGSPYSEVTPDLCWRHDNSFGVGGHNLQNELSSHNGKWLFMKIKKDS